MASKIVEHTPDMGSRDSTWYADTAAGKHLTHDLNDFLSPELDEQSEPIQTASGEVLHSKGAGAVYIPTIICNA